MVPVAKRKTQKAERSMLKKVIFMKSKKQNKTKTPPNMR
jgi:hypothetical protein